jgi:hypothetical protein
VPKQKKHSEDFAPARAIRSVVKSGATLADNGADVALSTSFADLQGIFETDSNTSAAWTVANVKAAEFGQMVTSANFPDRQLAKNVSTQNLQKKTPKD